MLVEDFRFAFTGGEQFEHSANIGAGPTVSQLSVAERAGAAFAEEIIALRIERSSRIEEFDVANALTHRRAAFEDERCVATPGQEIRRDEPARSRADYHGPMPQWLCAVVR